MSRDPDADPGDAPALTFAWTCALPGGGACGAWDVATVTIDNPSLGTATYALVVAAGGRVSAATAVQIVVAATELPVTSLSVPAYHAASGSLIVSGTVSAAHETEARWVLAGGVLADGADFGDAAGATSDPVTVPGGVAAEIFLSLPPGTLSPGAAYAFALEVTFSRGPQRGLMTPATATVVANRAPSSGSLAVAPRIGFAAFTPFTLTASRWVDDGGPPMLAYTYAQAPGDCESRACDSAPLLAESAATEHVALLARGGGDARLGVVYVSDALGARSRAVAPVTVRAGPLEQVSLVASTALPAAEATGDAEGLLAAIVAVADAAAGADGAALARDLVRGLVGPLVALRGIMLGDGAGGDDDGAPAGDAPSLAALASFAGAFAAVCGDADLLGADDADTCRGEARLAADVAAAVGCDGGACADLLNTVDALFLDGGGAGGGVGRRRLGDGARGDASALLDAVAAALLVGAVPGADARQLASASLAVATRRIAPTAVAGSAAAALAPGAGIALGAAAEPTDAALVGARKRGLQRTFNSSV